MKKSVLITGSSRGIGKAIAQRLAKEDYELVLHCVKQRQAVEDLAEHFKQSGVSVRVLQFDVSDRQACLEALTEDVQTHGCYYGVVLNAGVSKDMTFAAMDGKSWDFVLRTDLDSFYNVINPLVMPLVHRRKPGRIICISSVSGLIGNRGQVNYSAAKAGLIGASKALALELASRQITVNCVAPGLIQTDMVENAPIDEIIKLIPARRIGKPEDVAGIVNFLLSPEAQYITREVISVNGGLA